jgi:hypothetical protein
LRPLSQAGYRIIDPKGVMLVTPVHIFFSGSTRGVLGAIELLTKSVDR